MNEQIWYVYQNAQQIGPFTNQQLSQLHDSKMLQKEAYLFKVGWKDWRPLEDCYDELSIPGPSRPTIDPAVTEQRRVSAPRASIKGRVVVHNDNSLSIGEGVNISASGMFVETSEQLFNIGERIKISARCDGIDKAFNTIAHVIRYNSDPNFPVGYGFRFEGLEPAVEEEIRRLVANQNAQNNTAAGQS